MPKLEMEGKTTKFRWLGEGINTNRRDKKCHYRAFTHNYNVINVHDYVLVANDDHPDDDDFAFVVQVTDLFDTGVFTDRDQYCAEVRWFWREFELAKNTVRSAIQYENEVYVNTNPSVKNIIPTETIIGLCKVLEFEYPNTPNDVSTLTGDGIPQFVALKAFDGRKVVRLGYNPNEDNSVNESKDDEPHTVILKLGKDGTMRSAIQMNDKYQREPSGDRTIGLEKSSRKIVTIHAEQSNLGQATPSEPDVASPRDRYATPGESRCERRKPRTRDATPTVLSEWETPTIRLNRKGTSWVVTGRDTTTKRKHKSHLPDPIDNSSFVIGRKGRCKQVGSKMPEDIKSPTLRNFNLMGDTEVINILTHSDNEDEDAVDGCTVHRTRNLILAKNHTGGDTNAEKLSDWGIDHDTSKSRKEGHRKAMESRRVRGSTDIYSPQKISQRQISLGESSKSLDYVMKSELLVKRSLTFSEVKVSQDSMKVLPEIPKYPMARTGNSSSLAGNESRQYLRIAPGNVSPKRTRSEIEKDARKRHKSGPRQGITRYSGTSTLSSITIDGKTTMNEISMVESRRSVVCGKKNLTPGMPSRSEPCKYSHDVLEEARARMHGSVLPDQLPCRDKEYDDIYRFVEGKIINSTGGCMYISGVPGTGKTATVHEVIRQLYEDAGLGKIQKFQFLEINGMKLTDPHQAHVHLYKMLTGQKVTADHAAQLLEKQFSSKGVKRGSIVLLVDELDLLWNRKQDVLYNIFDWPARPQSKLIVVAIANTMDLPERIMKNRVSSRLGSTRLVFQPYTHKQLIEIVQSRLEELLVFDVDAIQLVARKVAAVSGDARRVLDICRRATELAERCPAVLSPSKSRKCLVGMNHVDDALQEMFSSPIVQTIMHLSDQEIFFLRALVSEFERSGLEEATFEKVYHQYTTLARFEGLSPLLVGELSAVCARLGAFRLCLVEHGRNDLLQRVRLNVSPDDVRYVLRCV